MSSVFLSASVSCIDPLNYKKTILDLDGAAIDGYHIDFCDGHFEKTLLLSTSIVKALRTITSKRLDVHLYCTNPSLYIDEIAEAGADLIIVQVEAFEDYRLVVKKIVSKGLHAGVGILPGSMVPSNLGEVIKGVGLVMLNTVGPAFSGQTFDIRGVDHISQVKKVITDMHADCEIGLDGAINTDRADMMVAEGGNHLVLGTSSIFSVGKSPKRELMKFRSSVEKEKAHV